MEQFTTAARSRPNDRMRARRRPSRADSPDARRLSYEPLEDRRLLAVDLTLLKDINLAPNPIGSTPEDFIEVGGVAYFTAETPFSGRELWRSDGTPEGTQMVADLLPGADSSAPQHLVNVDGSLFFVAQDDRYGSKTGLWKTDGTAAGTVRVPTAATYIDNPVAVDGILYFTATHSLHGNELWRSDGTAAGTYMVKDIRPGSLGWSTSHLTNVDGVLYFAANYGVHGVELWKSDGTESGTVMVKDIKPDGDSTPGHFVSAGGVTYFSAADPDTGAAVLWKTDGTAQGTVHVQSIPFAGGVEFQGRLYFASRNAFTNLELWRSDGTAEGTVQVRDLVPGTDGSYPANFVVSDETLFFTAQTTASSFSKELWRSDGTAAGTVLVKDLLPGDAGSDPRHLTSHDGEMFFMANLPDIGWALLKTDGTEQGTIPLHDLDPNPTSEISNMVSVGGKLLFQGVDPLHRAELWTTDGTPSGTRLLKDIAGANGDAPGISTTVYEGIFAEVNGVVYFTANDGVHGVELWRTDGTHAGTQPVKDLYPGPSGSNPSELTSFNGQLYFAATDDTGRNLWRTDGTPEGTVRVIDLYAGATGRDFQEMVVMGESLYFVASSHEFGTGATRTLWRSEGDEVSTHPVAQWPASSLYPRSYLTAFQNQVLFYGVSRDGFAMRVGLWTSDGSAAGTAPLRVFRNENYADPTLIGPITPAGDVAFFLGGDGRGGQLWRTDGTVTGTMEVGNFYVDLTDTLNFATIGDSLFFTAVEKTNPFQKKLWKTDGTLAGTFSLADVQLPSFPLHVAVAGDSLYYFIGHDLWRTDGTEAGTYLVKPQVPNLKQFTLNAVAVHETTLYFGAYDPLHGGAVWRTDGTPEGTVEFATVDLEPGDSFSPRELFIANDRLYVVASTEQYGAEIWTAPLPGQAAPGDFNEDGKVDGADFIFWQRRYGSSPALGSGADGNGDGVVDQLDLDVWTTAAQQNAPRPPRPTWRPPAATDRFASPPLAPINVSAALASPADPQSHRGADSALYRPSLRSRSTAPPVPRPTVSPPEPARRPSADRIEPRPQYEAAAFEIERLDRLDSAFSLWPEVSF